LEANDTIDTILEARGPMSASEMALELRKAGKMPPYWTVIDVADYLREWFGPAESSGDKT
jgi:hypothetical protein